MHVSFTALPGDMNRTQRVVSVFRPLPSGARAARGVQGNWKT